MTNTATDPLDKARKLFYYMGGGLAAVSCALAFAFGQSINSDFLLKLLISIGLVIAALGSAYAWPFVMDAFRKRAWGICAMLGAFALLFTAVDLTK